MYIIYDTATGNPRMSVNSLSLADTNLQDGEAYIRAPENYDLRKAVRVIDGEVVQQPAPEIIPLLFARQIRSSLLASSDWTQVADVALTDTKKAEWASYRQQLRDFPQTVTSNLGDAFNDAEYKKAFIEALLPEPPSA